MEARASFWEEHTNQIYNNSRHNYPIDDGFDFGVNGRVAIDQKQNKPNDQKNDEQVNQWHENLQVIVCV
jgi:hypothetical protein